MDDAIHGVILCLVDNAVRFVNIYQLDTDLPSGYCYLPFENGYWTWYVLVCIKIRIWRTGQHIPTQISGGSSSPPPPPPRLSWPPILPVSGPPTTRFHVCYSEALPCDCGKESLLPIVQCLQAVHVHTTGRSYKYKSHQLPSDRHLTSHNPVCVVSSTHVKRIMKTI